MESEPLWLKGLGYLGKHVAHKVRSEVATLIRRLRHEATLLGLPLAASTTPIQPLVLGDCQRVMEWASAASWSARSASPQCPAARHDCASP